MGNRSKQELKAMRHGGNIPALRARWVNVYELVNMLILLMIDAKKRRKEIKIIGSTDAAKLDGIVYGLLAIKEYVQDKALFGDLIILVEKEKADGESGTAEDGVGVSDVSQERGIGGEGSVLQQRIGSGGESEKQTTEAGTDTNAPSGVPEPQAPRE